MKDIEILQELTKELRKSGQEPIADALEDKIINLYRMRLPNNEKEADSKN